MLVAEIRHRAADDGSYLLPGVHSVKGRARLCNDLKRLFTLDVRLVDHPAIFIALLAQMRRQVGARLADRIETLQIPFGLELRHQHGGVGPLRKLRDHRGGSPGRRQ
jgi:hypothetical protein